MTHDTANGIIVKIETFDLEKFLRNYHFNSVFSDSTLEYIGKSITGITLKHMIVAIMLYKIFTPLRYLTTLAFAKISIDSLIRRGLIKAAPKESSLSEIALTTRKNIQRRATSIKLRRKNRDLLFEQKKKINDSNSTTPPPPSNNKQ